MCTHGTEGEQRKARVQNIIKSPEKNTIFNERLIAKSGRGGNVELDKDTFRGTLVKISVFTFT